jgi:hypothetical protein
MDRPRKLLGRASGHLAGFSGRFLRSVPGGVGAVLVSYGLYLAWLPLGFIAAGCFLLLIDRRVP